MDSLWTEALLVTLAALVTALATGLGALPFAFVRDFSASQIGTATAIAAGFMGGAAIGLVDEGLRAGATAWPVVIGAVVGLVAIAGTLRAFSGEVEELAEQAAVGGAIGHGHAHAHSHAHAHLPQMVSAPRWSRGLVIMAVMTAHSFSEGIGVGVAFGGGERLGLLITLAIAVHNIPEGLAISVVLVKQGRSVWYAAWMSIVSSLPQPVMALPAFLFVEQFSRVLPYGLGLAAGAMAWMAAADLLPDAARDAGRRRALAVAGASLVAMVVFQQVLAAPA